MSKTGNAIIITIIIFCIMVLCMGFIILLYLYIFPEKEYIDNCVYDLYKKYLIKIHDENEFSSKQFETLKKVLNTYVSLKKSEDYSKEQIINKIKEKYNFTSNEMTLYINGINPYINEIAYENDGDPNITKEMIDILVNKLSVPEN